MRFSVSVEEERDFMSIRIQGVSAELRELTQERLHELIPLLTEVLAFDETVSELSEADLQKRNRACAAMDLKYQVYLDTLVKLVATAKHIADGSEDIANYGFPEFSDA